MHPILNCLPDVWIGFSHGVLGKTMTRKALPKGVVHDNILDLANLLFKHQRRNAPSSKAADAQAKELADWLRTGEIRIVRISAANATPGFMGERIIDPDSAINVLVHSALALLYSTPCLKPGDFSKDWPP
jgi:hypothetical protein